MTHTITTRRSRRPTRRRAADQELLDKIAANVRARRGFLKLSQGEVGRAGDMHQNYVGALERGEVAPTIVTLARVARALDVPLSKLVDVDE